MTSCLYCGNQQATAPNMIKLKIPEQNNRYFCTMLCLFKYLETLKKQERKAAAPADEALKLV